MAAFYEARFVAKCVSQRLITPDGRPLPVLKAESAVIEHRWFLGDVVLHQASPGIFYKPRSRLEILDNFLRAP